MYVRSFSLLCFFGFRNSFCGIFPTNSNLLFINVVGYPLWYKIVCNSLRRGFLRYLSVIMVYILRAKVQGMDFIQFLEWWLLKRKYC